jgi:hypothetical protein
MEYTDIGQDKYDAVMKEVGLDKKDSQWPKGILFHAAGPIKGGGWHIVDVWEDKESFAKFRETRLLPAFEKIGGIPQPRVTISQVYLRKTIKP